MALASVTDAIIIVDVAAMASSVATAVVLLSSFFSYASVTNILFGRKCNNKKSCQSRQLFLLFLFRSQRSKH